MQFDIAIQPERLRVVRWDGDNDDEVNAYIASVNDKNGTAEIVHNEDGSVYIASPMGDKPLKPGAFVHAKPWMWGGPVVTVYLPEEARAQIYPYPTFDPVGGESSTSA